AAFAAMLRRCCIGYQKTAGCLGFANPFWRVTAILVRCVGANGETEATSTADPFNTWLACGFHSSTVGLGRRPTFGRFAAIALRVWTVSLIQRDRAPVSSSSC